MPAILRRTRSRSTTRVPFRENPVLADSEVLKQAGDERFVPVPQERMPVDQHYPAREDTPRQGDRRGVRQDDVDRVGAQVTTARADFLVPKALPSTGAMAPKTAVPATIEQRVVRT